MLSEKDVQSICYKALRQLNLGSGCDDFIRTLKSGNDSLASQKLQNIIHFSISECVYAALKETNKR